MSLENTFTQSGTQRDRKCSSCSPQCELKHGQLRGRLAVEEAACMLTLYPLDLFAGKLWSDRQHCIFEKFMGSKCQHSG